MVGQCDVAIHDNVALFPFVCGYLLAGKAVVNHRTPQQLRHRAVVWWLAGRERLWWQWKLLLFALAAASFATCLAVIDTESGPYPQASILHLVVLHVCMLVATHRAALYLLPALRFAWLVDGGFWVYDVLVGGMLLGVISVLCIGGVLAKLQAVLLFSSKFSRCGQPAREASNQITATRCCIAALLEFSFLALQVLFLPRQNALNTIATVALCSVFPLFDTFLQVCA